MRIHSDTIQLPFSRSHLALHWYRIGLTIVAASDSNLWQLGNTIRFTTAKLIPVISLKLVLTRNGFEPALD